MKLTYGSVASIWVLVFGFFASRTGAAALTGARSLALADGEDLMRMDSDKG